MGSRTTNLQKVIKKYYPDQITHGETPEATAARIIENLQQYKMITEAELFRYSVNFAKRAMEYCYPNSSGVPELQKELLNEYFQKCITGEHVSQN